MASISGCAPRPAATAWGAPGVAPAADLAEWHARSLSELLDGVHQWLCTETGGYVVGVAEDRRRSGPVARGEGRGSLTPSRIRNGIWPMERLPFPGRFTPSRWIGCVLQPRQLGAGTGKLGEHRRGRGPAGCVHLVEEDLQAADKLMPLSDSGCEVDIEPRRPRVFRTIGLRSDTEREEWSDQKPFLGLGSSVQPVRDGGSRRVVVALPEGEFPEDCC